jgi:pimeloyl-ACP methyl ester carboxylesterase
MISDALPAAGRLSRSTCAIAAGPIGAIPPDSAKQYPAHLTNADATLHEFFLNIQQLEKERASTDPVQFCKKFWALLRGIYVANPADAAKINWERCDLPTELNLMKYWLGYLLPSIQTVRLTAADLAAVKASVLTIHGDKDRSAPYGGAVDWASVLPDARLLRVEGAAHAPWIEAPEPFWNAIQTFLDGAWPPEARPSSLQATGPGC